MASLLQINAAPTRQPPRAHGGRAALEGAVAANLLSAPEVLANPTCRPDDRPRHAQADLQRERIKHLDDYPSVQQARAQIAAIDQQINAVAQTMRSSVRQQYDAALNAERNPEGSLAAQGLLAGRAGPLGALQPAGARSRYQPRSMTAAAALQGTERRRRDQREQHRGHRCRRCADQAQRADAGQQPGDRLVAGIVIAALVVLVRYQFDDAVRVPEDVEEKLGMPLLGSSPRRRMARRPMPWPIPSRRSAKATTRCAARCSIRRPTACPRPC
jgi:hypothetical protein